MEIKIEMVKAVISGNKRELSTILPLKIASKVITRLADMSIIAADTSNQAKYFSVICINLMAITTAVN